MEPSRDYPLSAFMDGLYTVWGRVLLVVVAIVVGAFLGGATATHTLAGALGAVRLLPLFTFASIFFASGLVILPAILVFTFLFARYDWPLWSVLLVTLVMWWSTHRMVAGMLRESPDAQQLIEGDKSR